MKKTCDHIFLRQQIFAPKFFCYSNDNILYENVGVTGAFAVNCFLSLFLKFYILKSCFVLCVLTHV